MSSGPAVLSETQAHWRGACVSLASDVDEVLKTFSTGIDDVAEKHGWCVRFFLVWLALHTNP